MLVSINMKYFLYHLHTLRMTITLISSLIFNGSECESQVDTCQTKTPGNSFSLLYIKLLAFRNIQIALNNLTQVVDENPVS